MRTTLWVVIGVLTLLAGCTDLDNESLYQCTSDADCSAGWMCLPLGSERVCVKEDSDLSWMSRDTFEPDAASDADVCVPVCDGRVCGPDGCGGECGVGCSGGELCNSVTGQCSATCTPTCSDRECGPDGCGGRCAPDACPLMSTCDEMAGQCECKVGYSRDGATCADIDECTANTDYCSPFATCTNTAGNFTCACNPGYSGNGIICTDLNECTGNADNCDAAATCTNTAGGFTCACNTGYSGDGMSCTDVNECTANPGNCSPNATCTNTSGSFTCACNAGYSGNGVTCSDVNECTANPGNCSVNATCTNTVGGFTCACKAGYSGNGVTCTDVNECTANPNNCSTNATCTNTSGSFTCACNAGYSGNGVTCSDVNECTANPNNCSTNATCTNTVGSYTCACNAGYSGNGVTCSDVNECTANPSNCSTNATCTNTSGSFTCACNAGYSGNGVTCTNAYVVIPSGSFTMGSPSNELGRFSEEVRHAVTLTRSFEMKKTEVTQGEWQSLMGNNPSYFSSCGVDCPLEQVTWYEALAYANALSAAKGLAACYTLTGCTGSAGAGMTCTGVTVTGTGGNPYACAGYRLPMEAEWEYAYRAGTTTAFYNGGISITSCGSDPNLNAIGWYCGNTNNTTHPAGQKQVNTWGLYDMSGNVFEWCWDWFGDYPGTVSNPVGPGTGSIRVLRGGTWSYQANFARAADREGDNPSARSSQVGFRLARSLP